MTAGICIKPFDFEKGRSAITVGSVTRLEGVLAIAMNPHEGGSRGLAATSSVGKAKAKKVV
jgi:hypothetical protein